MFREGYMEGKKISSLTDRYRDPAHFSSFTSLLYVFCCFFFSSPVKCSLPSALSLLCSQTDTHCDNISFLSTKSYPCLMCNSGSLSHLLTILGPLTVPITIFQSCHCTFAATKNAGKRILRERIEKQKSLSSQVVQSVKSCS